MIVRAARAHIGTDRRPNMAVPMTGITGRPGRLIASATDLMANEPTGAVRTEPGQLGAPARPRDVPRAAARRWFHWKSSSP